jgi:hypothetical protein
MRESEAELQRSKILSLRVPQDLFSSIEADAAQLGVSVATAARFRVRSGRSPRFQAGDE